MLESPFHGVPSPKAVDSFTVAERNAIDTGSANLQEVWHWLLDKFVWFNEPELAIFVPISS